MKVFHLNRSDLEGGAARAAYRIHQALRGLGIDSQMMVDLKTSGDWTVHGPRNPWITVKNRIRPRLVRPLTYLQRSDNPVLHSPAVIPSIWPRQLNKSDADLVNLHWIQGEMISISEIADIRKPIVWTLHDMWAFCGAEHYTQDARWSTGYQSRNRPAHESGFDLNAWTWRRKYRNWRRPIHLVSPSRWLADCVRQSSLMHSWPVTIVPNPLDMERWRPVDKSLARHLLGLPQDIPLLLFGAMGGGQDPRKGFDLLVAALARLRCSQSVDGLELVVFGQAEPMSPPRLGFPLHYTGHLHDDLSLRIIYSAADAMVISSRQDNLPNTGVESLACGTPLVAFDAGGMSDLVVHQRTGYLAKAFDIDDLSQGLSWVLERRSIGELNIQSRQYAMSMFSAPVVAAQYIDLYRQVCDL